MIHVQQFTSAADLFQHYAALKARMPSSSKREIEPEQHDAHVKAFDRMEFPIRGGVETMPRVFSAGDLPINPRVLCILRRVAAATGFAPVHIMGTSTHPPLTMARYHFWRFVFQFTTWTISDMGRRFGKDHSSIMYGLTMAQNDAEIRHAIRDRIVPPAKARARSAVIAERIITAYPKLRLPPKNETLRVQTEASR